ncbi:MAG TPA: flagellar basal-body MS-ring/collar protein FliF [Ramlibacter sp.]|nr:flagellar basal-body MS-ring/collar protein FliF [Ramlibacter sp.]
MIKTFWSPLERRAKVGLGLGAVLIGAALAFAAVWLLRTDYQVLFADLKPQDTAMMVAELDRMKVPYKIGNEGNTILVDGAIVHSTRLKLMGKDMPLHGAAGFELFNNADFGMTEFAQKINYQRALQGEITRTILALAEVQDVRVHLALPEEGLFKRATSKAKASITLGLKAGRILKSEQIAGIQRLVAGAVPGIAAQDVTIVDQQGVALTRPSGGAEGEQELGSGPLDLKRETEQLLVRKATGVLERAFGAGQALVTVDVTLNMDQVRVTTEEVLGGPTAHGQAQSGVLVREREISRDSGPPLKPEGGPAARAGSSQREVEYQVGRRVEQVATRPGAIRRMQVAAVVRHAMDAQQLEQMKTLVAAAVGAVAERGDTVVVQSMKAFETTASPEAVVPVVPPSGLAATAPVHGAGARDTDQPPVTKEGLAAVGLLLVSMIMVFLWWSRRAPRPRQLTEVEKQALLGQVQQWLEPAHAQQLYANVPDRSIGPAKGRT